MQIGLYYVDWSEHLNKIWHPWLILNYYLNYYYLKNPSIYSMIKCVKYQPHRKVRHPVCQKKKKILLSTSNIMKSDIGVVPTFVETVGLWRRQH